MKERILLIFPFALLVLILFVGSRPAGTSGITEPGDAVIASSTFVAQFRKVESSVAENPDGGVLITVRDGREETVYSFADVKMDDWYLSAVEHAVSSGLMKAAAEADGKQYFHPNYGVTRAEFAVILYQYIGDGPVAPVHEYADVTKDAPYYDAVCWVDANELLIGKETGFCPDDFLTCEQVLIILHRIAGKPKTAETLEEYPYVAKVSEYGRDALAWAWSAGLITETECIWYPPQAVSRAQIALLLQRYSDLIP